MAIDKAARITVEHALAPVTLRTRWALRRNGAQTPHDLKWGMDTDALQHAINELVHLEFRPPKTAAWVKAVEAAPANVIAGAIVMWLHRVSGLR
jgi:hypothetical protein